jgi:DNA replication protein DnaC
MRFVILETTGFPETVPCPEGCANEIAQRRLEAISNVTGDRARLTLDGHWHHTIRPAVDMITAALSERRPSGFILLAGGYGIGKSHILMAAINQAVADGHTAVYATAEDLLDCLRQSYSSNDSNSARLFENIQQAQVVAIDEIDRINPTAWSDTQLFRLFNNRYEEHLYGSGHLTIMATNREVAGLDGYLLSRLRDEGSAIFEMWDARDFRQARRKLQESGR